MPCSTIILFDVGVLAFPAVSIMRAQVISGANAVGEIYNPLGGLVE